MVGVGAVAVLGACRVDMAVKVESDELGAGRITVRAVLDETAAAAFLGPRGATPGSAVTGAVSTTVATVDRLRVDDLRRSGWDGPGLVGRADGTALVALGHRFTTVDEANTLLKQLSGPDGPFARLRLGRSRSPWATTISLTGPGDFRNGLAAFGDAKLGSTTGGGPFGISEAEVLRQAGASKLSDVLTVRLDGQLLDRTSTWTFVPGAATPIALSSRRISWAAIAAAASAVLALAAFVLLGRRSGESTDVVGEASE